MTISIAEFTCNTSTGTQDITGSLGGDTPVGVLLVVSGATVDDTAASHGRISIGAATGTSELWSMATMLEDNKSTSDSNRSYQSTMCITMILPDGSLDGEADLDSFISNGARIDWQTAVGTAYKGMAIFFHGDGVECHAGIANLDDEDVAVDVTAPGFEPSGLIMSSQYNASVGIGSFAYPSIGWATNKATDTNHGIAGRDRDGRSSVDWAMVLNNDRVLWEMNFQNAAESYSVMVDGYDSSGFDITTKGGNGSSEGMGYLAFSGVNVTAGVLDTPVTVTTLAETGIGFSPDSLLLGLTQLESENTPVESAANGVGFGVGAYDGTTTLSVSFNNEHNASTSVTQSVFATDLDIRDPDDSAGVSADVDSLDADGFTLDFTAVKGNAKKWIYLAFGDVSEADVLSRGLSGIESGVVASGGGGYSGLHPIERGYIS